MSNKEEKIEHIKTYTDTRISKHTIGVSYRCKHCGVIWQKLKDAQAHSLNCKKEVPHGK